MAAVTLLVSMVLAQATVPVVAVEGERDRVDVAYSQLRDGDAAGAIARIESNRRLDRDDPAALINLAAAHARLGHADIARKYYLAAVASQTRYELELADGRWMDSRRAARMGYAGVESGQVLALR